MKAIGLWLLMTGLSEAQYLLGRNTDGQCQNESLTSEYEIFRFWQIKSSLIRFRQFQREFYTLGFIFKLRKHCKH